MNDRLKMRNIKGNAAQMIRNLSNLELGVILGRIEKIFGVVHASHPLSLHFTS